MTPVDNSVLTQVVQGTVEDMDAACEAAHDAFASWRDTPGHERKAILHRVADRIDARAEEIALIESIDCGQPIRFMKKAAMRGAANFRFFADKAPEAGGRSRASPGAPHQLHDAPRPSGRSDSSRRGNTPFHAVHLEDRARARRRLHRRP